MTSNVTHADIVAATSVTADQTRRTRILLGSGAAAGPIFIAAGLIQAVTRTGFDPVKHPLSLLSAGDLGWIQITSFVLAGLMFLLSAFGTRRALHPGRASTWGPILIGAFGVALVGGGVFVADPALGFPPGTPDGVPDTRVSSSLADRSGCGSAVGPSSAYSRASQPRSSARHPARRSTSFRCGPRWCWASDGRPPKRRG
jgi:hypothetical protein